MTAWLLTPRLRIRFGLMAIVHEGILDPGTWFIQKPFTSKQLVQKGSGGPQRGTR
jgi:hypothetical protein